MAPRFSVIIPTKDRPESVARCISALSPAVQNADGFEFEVIIADDGNSDAELPPWARRVTGPRAGPAANRNAGAFHAHGQWLVFVDDDCIPLPNLLNAYARAINENPTIEVLEGSVHADREKVSMNEYSPINTTGGLLWSCNLAVTKTLFARMGGFDPRFPYAAMEDIDFRYRLEKGEHRSLFVPDAQVCHPWRRRIGYAPHRQHQESTILYLTIHPEERARINSGYYVRLAVYGLFRDLLPEFVRFRGRGFAHAILEKLSYLHMAIRLGL